MGDREEASDAELALQLHQELNGLTRRRSPSERGGPWHGPSANVSPGGSGSSLDAPHKKPRLEPKTSDQAQGASGVGEPSQLSEDGTLHTRPELKPWSTRRQRSPVTPDSAQVGWVKKECATLSAPMNACLQGDVAGTSFQGKSDSGATSLDPEQEAAAKVRRALAIYNHERLHQVVLEEERVKRGGGAKRADLKTLHAMREKKQVLHAGTKVIGHFPG